MAHVSLSATLGITKSAFSAAAVLKLATIAAQAKCAQRVIKGVSYSRVAVYLSALPTSSMLLVHASNVDPTAPTARMGHSASSARRATITTKGLAKPSARRQSQAIKFA